MKRSTFERESQILGKDFNSIIDQYGGKVAGLMLAQEIQKERFNSDFLIPPYTTFTTDLYNIAEEILLETHPNPLQEYLSSKGINECPFIEDNDHAFLNKIPVSETLLRNQNFVRELEKSLRHARHKFGENNKDMSYHLRSSTTKEDFRDDRYYGTFESLGAEKSFLKHKSNQKLPLVYHAITLIKRFHAMKHFNEEKFELGEDDSLAMLLMPSVNGLHVTSYSSYPEIPNSPVVHEVSSTGHYSWEDPKPKVFIKVHGNTIEDIEIIPAGNESKLDHNLEERIDEGYLHETRKCDYELENPYEINGVRSPLSVANIGQLTRMVKTFEDRLGYSVNTESIFEGKGSASANHLVQLRPVPTLENYSPLQKVDDSLEVLMQTPFVYGAFTYTAPILFLEDKNVGRLGMTIPRPVILWDDEYHKGHRLYWTDNGDNCLALLNPNEGRTLSHHTSILPPFGERRNSYHAIGAPGLSSKIYDKLQHIGFLNDDKSREGKFKISPFSLTIESDGREGRISIAKKDLHFLE